MSAAPHASRQHRRHGFEGIGENVRDDHVVLCLGQRVWQTEVRVDSIQRRVVDRGGDGLRVDVDADDFARPELDRGDREDARATTIIEHRLAAADIVIQPTQTQSRGGMTAGAEGQAGIEL